MSDAGKAAEMYSHEYHKVLKENQQLRAALVSARTTFDILAKLGNGEVDGNSVGNCIAKANRDNLDALLSGQPVEDPLDKNNLPGMWDTSDFEGGATDCVAQVEDPRDKVISRLLRKWKTGDMTGDQLAAKLFNYCPSAPAIEEDPRDAKIEELTMDNERLKTSWKLLDECIGEEDFRINLTMTAEEIFREYRAQLATVTQERDSLKEQIEETTTCGTLMDAWIAEHGTQIPWAKAVELISTVMKYPESERNRLLCLDTPDLPKQLAAAQAVQEILEQRLSGAIHAIKELKECIPPKDFKAYAQTVLDTYAMRGKEGE